MPSHDLDAAAEPRSDAGVLYRLLDPLFGFFVWAIHFLAVYVGAAVACVVRVDAADAGTRATVLAALVAVTLAAAALVIWHAVRTYRARERVLDRGFLVKITIGHDALAALAILWQLFPLFLVPLCR